MNNVQIISENTAGRTDSFDPRSFNIVGQATPWHPRSDSFCWRTYKLYTKDIYCSEIMRSKSDAEVCDHCTTQRFFLTLIFSAVDARRGVVTVDVTVTTVVSSSWRACCCAWRSWDAGTELTTGPSVLSGATPLPRLLLLLLAGQLSTSGSAICNSVREIRECVMMKSALRWSSPLARNGLLASASCVGSLTQKYTCNAFKLQHQWCTAYDINFAS